MSEMEIRQYAKDKGFHPQTLERWLGWDQSARDDLFRLAVGLKLGENHLRDLMDWLEEIALRDQSTIERNLSKQADNRHRVRSSLRPSRQA